MPLSGSEIVRVEEFDLLVHQQPLDHITQGEHSGVELIFIRTTGLNKGVPFVFGQIPDYENFSFHRESVTNQKFIVLFHNINVIFLRLASWIDALAGKPHLPQPCRVYPDPALLL